MKRRRVEESADGLALMTSSMTSSYSADGLREQSQESAGSLYIQTQERSDVVEEEIQSQATSQDLRIQSQALRIQSQALESQTQEKKKQAKFRDSSSRKLQYPLAGNPVAKTSSRSDGSAAKQLIIYKSWMSTAERNSNGESDKTQSTLKMERING
ncbi:hypothetical protein F511_37339 [Dorcoceras hygrometricum]|uniref:Uncharacterized protein n=1 Tax=Dorcoceras hygrometricum TaxID=472368 RepID=A0A2Z7ACA0_9LAMI|nr:hypothetical protein F511_37339 [Dorcoceras hygrometricum]